MSMEIRNSIKTCSPRLKKFIFVKIYVLGVKNAFLQSLKVIFINI